MNAIVDAINTMQTQLANPFTFKGSVSTVSNLPSSGNTINDTYYVTSEYRLYSWTGSAWDVSSLSETEYLTEINAVKSAFNQTNYNLTLEGFNPNFDEHKFITVSSGVWSDNTSNPYLYSEQIYYSANKESPYAVTMNDSSMQFRAHLYSGFGQGYFILTTNWFSGDEKFIVSGNYNGTDYSYIRYTVAMKNWSYSTAIFNSLVNAFTAMQTTDTSLSIKRAPADAKVTGEKIDILNDSVIYDITDLTNVNWAIDMFIAESTGNYESNVNFPYLFGQRAFYRINSETPIAVTMGSDDYLYCAFFYTDAGSNYFVGKETSYHSGSNVTYYNGLYNGTQYNYVRFNIYRNDRAYSETAFNECKNSFCIQCTSKYGLRAYGDMRFYVRTNLAWPDTDSTAVDTGEIEDNVNVMGILRLPYTYKQKGNPVPLIMLCHGASAHVSDTYWYNTGSNITTLVNAFESAGYAVFDVDNTRGVAGGYPDWGGLPLMTAYIHAWEYIKQNYNVESKLYIYSMSMGTCAALNMMKWYPGEIVASIMSAPRPFCKYRYNTLADEEYKAQMAEAFGLGQDGVWDTDRLRGFDHYDNIIEIDGIKYVPEKFPPCKVMVGKSDSSFLEETREYYQALGNSCNYVNYREVTGADHTTMTFLTDPALRAEAVSWFNRFQNYSEV